MHDLQAVILRLPALSTLHVFVETSRATRGLLSFLDVLPEVPSVRSLRAATQTFSVNLPANILIHLSSLEIGGHVTLEQPPAHLAQLRLESVESCFAAYASMFTQVEALTHCDNLILDTFTVGALLVLPTNLRRLSLSQPFKQSHFAEHSQFDVCRALIGRLLHLETLHIGNFLTDFAMNLFLGLLLPRVHTFSFRVHDSLC